MNRVKDIFKNKGVKATAQRLIVYKALEQIGHATVDDVVTLVNQAMPTISVATIYNILELLSQSGVISKLYTDDKRLYYDITASSHHHLYSNGKDVKIVDYNDPELTEMIFNHLSGKKIDGFRLGDIKLELVGTFE